MAKADKYDLKMLKKDLDSAVFAPVYIFWGEETYLRDYYLDRLIRKIAGNDMREFNYHRFEGRKTDLDRVFDAADNLPMFSEKKLIHIADYDIFRAPAKDEKQVLRLLDDLPEYCHVVFIYDTVEYKPDARTKLYAHISKAAKIVHFEQQGSRELIPWIKRRFEALDREIETAQAEYLIFLCGGLMTALISEIEKIASYAGEKRISKEDIDAVAVPTLEAIVYDMTDAVSAGRFDSAADILDRLFAQKHEPVMLVGAISRQVRQLYTARLALDFGRPAACLADMWGFRSNYPAQRLASAAKSLDAGWCRRAVKLCAEADYELKTKSGDKQRTLELLIFKLAQARQG